MRQTVAITVGLSFYEVGSLLMRTFPVSISFFFIEMFSDSPLSDSLINIFHDTYNDLPQQVRDLTFYFRLETICAINFIVYYMGSPSTRKMLKKYFRSGELKRDLSTRKISSTFQMSRIET